jgi:hypothetical protein
MMKVWVPRIMVAAFAALALLIFAGSIMIGASVWDGLLITSSLMLAAVMTVVGGSVLLLRPGSWLRERLDRRAGATRSSSETTNDQYVAPTQDDA